MFIDANHNGKRDPGEPSAATSDSGDFSFPSVHSSAAPVALAMAGEDLEACRDSATLESPVVQMIAPAGCPVVSPLSTLTHALTKGAKAYIG